MVETVDPCHMRATRFANTAASGAACVPRSAAARLACPTKRGRPATPLQAPTGPLKDGCPCGSNKYYRDCCKRFHQGGAVASIEDTLRARYSAVVKKVRRR